MDGLMLMRYTHLYRERSSGGVEQYLHHLNHALLQRHRLTILQTHLIDPGATAEIDTQTVGLGRIVWVPIVVRRTTSVVSDLPARLYYILTHTFRRSRELGAGQFCALLCSVSELLAHNAGHVRYRATVLSRHLTYLLRTEKVDLLALHWLSYDTGCLISEAIRIKLPFVIINHFSNALLSLPGAHRWVTRASALGGVSARDIPDDMRTAFIDLSDAVDTNFFASDKARPLQVPEGAIILLPARVEVGKGHRDLVEAVAHIVSRGNGKIVLGFVGAVDCAELRQELERFCAAVGLGSRAMFLGEISQQELRDWYAASSVVVLPSYSEGLGRVLLEAQAMKKPVVAFDCGGIGEAVLPNQTGFLLKPGDVEALADRIGFLLEHEAERLRMGECGREFVSRKFGTSALIQRHEAFYLGALGLRPGQARSRDYGTTRATTGVCASATS
jgi:glycosyltransferase involved in cell wall biosynthesis